MPQIKSKALPWIKRASVLKIVYNKGKPRNILYTLQFIIIVNIIIILIIIIIIKIIIINNILIFLVKTISFIILNFVTYPCSSSTSKQVGVSLSFFTNFVCNSLGNALPCPINTDRISCGHLLTYRMRDDSAIAIPRILKETERKSWILNILNVGGGGGRPCNDWNKPFIYLKKFQIDTENNSS